MKSKLFISAHSGFTAAFCEQNVHAPYPNVHEDSIRAVVLGDRIVPFPIGTVGAYYCMVMAIAHTTLNYALGKL